MKRFSIRDLLFLMVILSLALAWWVDRKNSVQPAGQYQMQVVQGRAFVLDTETGQVWERAFDKLTGNSSPDFAEPKSIK